MGVHSLGSVSDMATPTVTATDITAAVTITASAQAIVRPTASCAAGHFIQPPEFVEDSVVAQCMAAQCMGARCAAAVSAAADFMVAAEAEATANSEI